MKVYSNDTFAQVYRDLLTDLMSPEGQISDPRSSSTKEIVDVCLEIKNPISSLYKNEIRSSQKRYIAAEFIWYFMGRNDVEFISKFAKFWKNIQNPDETVNSSYGHLLFTKKNKHGLNQYQWALQSLQKDINSRQAVLHFNLPEHQHFENKDFVCTMYASFLIRNNKLRMSVKMRSNDVILGLPTDIAFFTVLQQQLLQHLKQTTYPNLELGSYSHIVDSMHIYERDFEKATAMLEHDFIAVDMPKLEKNLISEEGNASIELCIVELDIEEKEKTNHNGLFDLLSPDKMLGWIYYHLNKEYIDTKKQQIYEK